MRTGIIELWGIALIILAAAVVSVAQSTSGVLELVSVSSEEVQGNNESGTGGFTTPSHDRAGISADGRFVAFMSRADNLVPGDTNGSVDFFVRDRVSGTTERVSVTSKGRQADPSTVILSIADISVNGQFVTFAIDAGNLVRGDTNGNADVFVFDRVTRALELISVDVNGQPGTGDSPSISDDGRFVAFASRGQTLVLPHSEFDLFSHIYVFDRQTRTMQRVDVDAAGNVSGGDAFSPQISANGQFIAFETTGDNLIDNGGDGGGIDVFVRDRVAGVTQGISTVGDSGQFEGESFVSSISSDGRFVGFSSPDPTFPGVVDTNGFGHDAFIFDRNTNTVELVSVSTTGQQGGDLTTSSNAMASTDGNTVIFSSNASLVAGDNNDAFDVYRRNRLTRTTERITTGGVTFDSDAIAGDMTPDARAVSLITAADLLPTDVNLRPDVYVIQGADVAVTMTDSPDPVRVRANLTYTVTVSNSGPGTAIGVTLTDPLSADVVFVSATSSQGTCARSGGGSRDGLLTCALGSINAGASATVTIVVSPRVTGTLTNTATVQANTADPNTANNTATATTTVVR